VPILAFLDPTVPHPVVPHPVVLHLVVLHPVVLSLARQHVRFL
jgi:hypothetical protein